MRSVRRKGRLGDGLLGGILAVAIVALSLLPASASARKPIIAYLEGGQFKRFDAETGTDLAPLPIPANAGMRFAQSRNGRYVFYSAGGLHLFDRDLGTAGAEVPLPGINIYAQPAFLTVSNNGLLGFDNNIMNGAVLYNSATGAFAPTGFPPGMTTDSEHRQPNLSGSGQFLATTCLMAASCEVDLGSDSNPYVQDLSTLTDTGVPDDNARSEEDPCISGDGDLVGWHKVGPVGMDTDLLIYRRSTATNITATLTGLNDANLDDNHCAIDSSGNYIGYMQNNVFKLYEISSLSQVTLPAKPFELSNNVNNILADPFTQSPRPVPASTPSTAAQKRKKCRRKRRHKGKSAAVAKKKHCKKKRKHR
jgi:hypothetical protein